MESLSVCEKNLDWFGGEKLKEISFQNTLKNLSFWYDNFVSKTSGDKHLEV